MRHRCSAPDTGISRRQRRSATLLGASLAASECLTPAISAESVKSLNTISYSTVNHVIYRCPQHPGGEGSRVRLLPELKGGSCIVTWPSDLGRLAPGGRHVHLPGGPQSTVENRGRQQLLSSQAGSTGRRPVWRRPRWLTCRAHRRRALPRLCVPRFAAINARRIVWAALGRAHRSPPSPSTVPPLRPPTLGTVGVPRCDNSTPAVPILGARAYLVPSWLTDPAAWVIPAALIGGWTRTDSRFGRARRPVFRTGWARPTPSMWRRT